MLKLLIEIAEPGEHFSCSGAYSRLNAVSIRALLTDNWISADYKVSLCCLLVSNVDCSSIDLKIKKEMILTSKGNYMLVFDMLMQTCLCL